MDCPGACRLCDQGNHGNQGNHGLCNAGFCEMTRIHENIPYQIAISLANGRLPRKTVLSVVLHVEKQEKNQVDAVEVFKSIRL